MKINCKSYRTVAHKFSFLTFVVLMVICLKFVITQGIDVEKNETFAVDLFQKAAKKVQVPK